MATNSVSMTLPLNSCLNNKLNQPLLKPSLQILPKPNKTVLENKKNSRVIGIKASLKEKAVTGLTAASFAASMVVPEMAHAAGNDFSPSLKNFLLSIVAGGVVLVAIFGAVIGVSNFDPVKRT